MGEHFDDLFSCQAILLREFDMPRQLLHSPQRRQCGQRNQAAFARRKRVTLPDVIEKNLLTEFGQLWRNARQRFPAVFPFLLSPDCGET